ncbi:MAG: hypothetical protein ACI3T9_03770 [Romboutsia timonensis]
MKDTTVFNICIIVFIFVVAFLIGWLIAIYTPSPYEFVLVNYKFIKGNDCYIVGETTSPNGKSKIDIYKVNTEDYEEFLEGFEYSISTTGQNDWHRMYKEIVDFKQMIYD